MNKQHREGNRPCPQDSPPGPQQCLQAARRQRTTQRCGNFCLLPKEHSALTALSVEGDFSFVVRSCPGRLPIKGTQPHQGGYCQINPGSTTGWGRHTRH